MISGDTWPGVAPAGKWIRLKIMLAAKMPTPETALATRLEAEKNRPSARRPVFSSPSSTTSAIIAEIMVVAAI